MLDRLIYVTIFIFISCVALGYKSYSIMFGDLNIEHTNLMILNRTPISVIALSKEAIVLDGMSKDIESYSFKDIKEELRKTSILVDNATREIDAQYQSWMSLKTKFSGDVKTYQDLKEKLDNIQSLQDKEIIRLKDALEAAQKPTLMLTVVDGVYSFLFGVISTVISAYFIYILKRKFKILSKLNL